MHLSRNCPFSDKTDLHLELPGWHFCGERPKFICFGRKHPSRDVIFSGQISAKKLPTIITSHDVLEPLKQVLSASRSDVIISGQNWGSKLQRVFTLGDGCWLPIHLLAIFSPISGRSQSVAGQRDHYSSLECPNAWKDFLRDLSGLLARTIPNRRDTREGANREKLTVKKLISITGCFFTVCVPYKP